MNLRITLVTAVMLAAAAAGPPPAAAVPPDPSALSADARRALRRANTRVQRGNGFVDEGLLRKAELEYRAAIDIFPKHVDALYNLAVLLRRGERSDEAETCLNRVVEIDPGAVDAMTDLADMRSDAGDPSGAEAMYRRAIEVDERFPRAWAGLGYLLQKTGRAKEAVTAYERCVRLNEEVGRVDPFAWYNLGCALLEAGQPARAKKVLLQAADVVPDHYLVNNALGNVYLVQGLSTQALLRFRRAQKRKPDYPPIYEGLGDVSAARDETERAVEHYRHALELRGDYAAVHIKLARLLRESQPEQALLHFRAYLRYGTLPDLREEAINACRELAGEGSMDDVPASESQGIK